MRRRIETYKVDVLLDSKYDIELEQYWDLSEEDKQPKATHSSSKTKAEDYPQVYGPDVKTVPGHKDQHQDSSRPEPYDFVPAAEFPKGPVAPSPFLTDFSKIMK
jgi:hypothetical protein